MRRAHASPVVDAAILCLGSGEGQAAPRFGWRVGRVSSLVCENWVMMRSVGLAVATSARVDRLSGNAGEGRAPKSESVPFLA